MKQNTFEQLSKEEQTFRWAIFLESNGYNKDLTDQRIEELRVKHLEDKKPLSKSYFE